MDLTGRLVLLAALITFLIAVQTRNRLHLYTAATMLLVILIITFTPKGLPPAEVAQQEIRTETLLIDQAAALARQAHEIVENAPSSKAEAAEAHKPNGEAARFYLAEQNWLTRAEHGKPLDSFVDPNASTAAIRIVAVDSFLTGAVASAIENCNDHDSSLNLALADKIIDDARKSLSGHGDPHFPTPDLSRQLDGSNNCVDDNP